MQKGEYFVCAMVTLRTFFSNMQTSSNKIVKMITFGKYKNDNGRYIIPLTLQISHAIADGYHVSLFYENCKPCYLYKYSF